MVETPALRDAHHEGFYGAVGPSMEAFYGLILDPAAGLLPLTPILTFSLIGFGLLVACRKHRTDGLIALSIAALTLLAICSMNNWRGGWTIGPRYLATIVPFVAWATLYGLDRLALRFPILTFCIALGTTAVALVASSIPSAYYPHLPPEFSRPLPQLFYILIAHDYAPYTAAGLLNIHGTASMAPLFLVAGLILLLCMKSIFGLRNRIKVLVGSGLIMVFLVWPLSSSGDTEVAISNAVAFITRNWTPQGHDLASKLERKMHDPTRKEQHLARRLKAVYLKEGRKQEARRIVTRNRAL